MFSTPRQTIAFLAFVAFAGVFLWRSAIGVKGRRAARIRRERFASNQCVFCGYSLAGNESGVCPECGKVVQIPDPESAAFSKQTLCGIPGGRSLFTRSSTASLTLCIAAGVAYFATMRVTMYDPLPELTSHTVPGLGWTCVGLAGLTFILFLKRGQEIRTIDDRLRHGLCRNCGYDLRESSGKCPQCGETPDSTDDWRM